MTKDIADDNSHTIISDGDSDRSNDVLDQYIRHLNDLSNEQLKVKLMKIRNNRRQIYQLRQACQRQQELLESRHLNGLLSQRQYFVDKYVGTQAQLEHTLKFVDEYASRWHTLNDCFFIWHTGPYGFSTINGCRLGSVALHVPPPALCATMMTTSTTATAMTTSGRQQQQQTGNGGPSSSLSPTQQQRNYLGLFGGHRGNNPATVSAKSDDYSLSSMTGTSNMNSHQGSNRNNVVGTGSNGQHPHQRQMTSRPLTQNQLDNYHHQQQQHQRVPWSEINAALGHACFLLKVLQENSNRNGRRRKTNDKSSSSDHNDKTNSSGNESSSSSSSELQFTHELYPMGSTSKIGIRFYNPKTMNNKSRQHVLETVTPVIYNLYYEENNTGGLFSLTSLFRNDIKNFNLALQAFVQCVSEMARYMYVIDKTLAIPHEIRYAPGGATRSSTSSSSSSSHHESTTNNNNKTVNGGGVSSSLYPFQRASATSNADNNKTNNNSYCYLNGGEWTVGGISICYPQVEAVATTSTNKDTSGGSNINNQHDEFHTAKMEWTRACKYLLTDLKWIIASTAKHVDT